MGFGSLFAGFVKGASDYGVDQIQRRQRAEEEIKKQVMLEKLRLDTEKEMAVFRDKLQANDVDHTLSTPDYARNKLVYRNNKGEVVSERDLSPSEIQAHDLETKTSQASLDNTLSAISSRAHDDAVSSGHLALDQQRTAQEITESKARTAHINDDGSGLDGKKVLSKEYNNTITELTKAGANPAILADFQTNWYDGVNNNKWTPSQQRVFLMEMRKRFTRKDSTDPKGRPLLERFSSANSALDQALKDNSDN